MGDTLSAPPRTEDPAGRHEEMRIMPLSEIQRQIARERPRDPKKAVEGALKELALFPDFAEKAYYSIPYNDNRKGTRVFVEGPSIKAAMAMMRFWGNCTSAWRVAEERDDRVICEGLYYDYESNILITRPVEVMRYYRSRDGKLIRRDANQMHLGIQAAGSKAARNAELAGMPVAFVDIYFAEAKRIVALPRVGLKEKSIQERVDNAKTHLMKTFGVTQAEIDSLLKDWTSNWLAEKDGNEPTAADEFAMWKGVYNAIHGKETTVEAAFGRTSKAGGAAMPLEEGEGDTTGEPT